MSTSACYEGMVRATNNLWTNCPPIMADGRAFTDYRPKGVQVIQDIVPLNKGSYEYREYMESHGDRVMMNQRRVAYATNTCGPCKKPYAKGTLVPELSRETCGVNSCEFVQESVDGVGLGRNFGESLESAYGYTDFLDHKRKEQDELEKPPCNIAYDPFHDFPVRYDGPGSGRLAIPEGGDSN